MKIKGKIFMGALFALITLGAVSSLSAWPSSSWLRNLLRNHTVIYVHGMKFKDYTAIVRAKVSVKAHGISSVLPGFCESYIPAGMDAWIPAYFGAVADPTSSWTI